MAQSSKDRGAGPSPGYSMAVSRRKSSTQKTLSDFGCGGCLIGEMKVKSDAELLREYAQRGSEAAFGEIVARYTDLVYSAARRQVGATDPASDIAQSVFTDL